MCRHGIPYVQDPVYLGMLVVAELFRSLPNDSDTFVFYSRAALQSATIHKVASVGRVSVYEFHSIYSTD